MACSQYSRSTIVVYYCVKKNGKYNLLLLGASLTTERRKNTANKGMLSGRNNVGSMPRLRQSSLKNFNPRLIFSQIVAMQCCHYLFLGFLFQINHVLYGQSITIDRMFTDEYLKVWQSVGWPDTFAVFISYSVVGMFRSFLMAVIVEKSKKCLDFSFTLFIVHLVIVCAYDGFPTTWDWWIVHICSMVTMVLLGEYLCARREMEDIPILQL